MFRFFAATLFAVTILSGMLGQRVRADSRTRPNVLLILTDDQGWGDVAAHGNRWLKSPVLDELRLSGARFERFFVSSYCAPSRAALLTGRYPFRTGVTGVTHRREVMRSEEVTLAEIFREDGYVTGCFGKWHNGMHHPYHPNGQGFDEFFGFCGGHWNDYADPMLERDGTPVRTEGYITDVLTDAAIDFIAKPRNEPFFAYVPFNAPHAPYQVPDRFAERLRDAELDETTRLSYAMTENLDENIGRLLKSLDDHDLAEKTIVVFLTDNGPDTWRYNGGMRGKKGSRHEGGMRVPCFIRWPGRIRSGTRIEPIAAHIDLLPTLASLCEISNPKTLPLDGVDLSPLLLRTSKDWPERMLFDEDTVRTQRYRYGVPDETLYDMQADPGETKDVAGEHPELARKLKQAYAAWFADVIQGTKGMPPPIPVGHEQRAVVDLPASECEPTDGLEFNHGPGWSNSWLRNWTSTAERAVWDLNIVRPGRYEVTLFYCCPKDDVGATVRIEVEDRSTNGRIIEGVIEKAHDPPLVSRAEGYAGAGNPDKQFASLPLGLIKLRKGPAELTAQATKIPGRQAFEIRTVRLRRVDPD